MADIAGAMAAIEARLIANFPDLQVALPNKDPEDPSAWPPRDAATGRPVAWLYCEIVDVDSKIIGFGKPGAQTILDTGFVKIFVMVEKGSGQDAARDQATAIGEVFRQARFYDDTPPAYVRTKTPRIGTDPMISEDGITVAGACCTVPYEFLHRG